MALAQDIRELDVRKDHCFCFPPYAVAMGRTLGNCVPELGSNAYLQTTVEDLCSKKHARSRGSILVEKDVSNTSSTFLAEGVPVRGRVLLYRVCSARTLKRIRPLVSFACTFSSQR